MNITPEGIIHNISFSSLQMNGNNKADCYITQGWKCLPWAKTVVYWAHSLVTKKCCEYDTRRHTLHFITNTTQPKVENSA